MLCPTGQKSFQAEWISIIQFDNLGCFFIGVLLGVSPTLVQTSSTAFLVVVLNSREHYVQRSSLYVAFLAILSSI